MHRVLSSVLTAIGLLAAPAALAQDAVKIKITDYMATNHYLTEAGLKPWIQEVTAAAKGKIAIEHYPSQQLGKATDSLRLTQTGVAQMANLTPSMAGDKLELSGVAELPGLFETSCQGTNAYMKAGRSGVLADEFAASGVRLMYAVVFRELQMFARTRPVDGLTAVKGQKIMVPMRPTELMLGKAGAVTQRLPSGPDAYQALQRGTIDSVVMVPESIHVYDIHTLVKHATQNGRFGQLLTLYVMNLQTWNGLDAATRSAIDAASDKAAQRGCKAVDDGFMAVFDRFRKDGIQVKVFSAQELVPFNKAAEETAGQWVEGVAQRGKKGAEAVTAIRTAAGTPQ